MAKYCVWDPEQDDEADVKAGKWAEYEADNEDCAAQEKAEEMAESGDYPDHFKGESQTFDLHVRNLEPAAVESNQNQLLLPE
jgi:hypothetical protein